MSNVGVSFSVSPLSEESTYEDYIIIRGDVIKYMKHTLMVQFDFTITF